MKLAVKQGEGHGHIQQHQSQRRESPRRPQPPYLFKGSVVEVSSDEEGLKGAWYPATILNNISPTKKRSPYSGKFYVEYKRPVSDEDRSKPLREYVKAECVRPLPPVESHPGPFNIGDIVDAYYSDGWWTGVITDIVEGSKLKVTFQFPPDSGLFCPSDLRVHLDWVNDSWIRTANQIAAGLMFSVGKKVEVSIKTGGSEDIWFPATVLEDKGNGLFVVEYKCNRDGGSGNVKANVYSSHIQPCPPQLKERSFSLLEKVDAFYDFGWWSGVITKELAESRYIVFFRHSKKEREHHFSELRPHMEWKDSNWFSSSQVVSFPSDNYIYDGFAEKKESNVGVTVSLSNSMPTNSTCDENMPFSSPSKMNKIELVTPSNDEPQVINSSRRKMTSDSTYSGKEALKVEAHEAAPSTETNASYNTSEILSKVASAEKVTQPLGTDQLNGSHSSVKNVKRKRGTLAEKEETAVVRSGKTPENKVQVKTSQNTIGDKEGNETDVVNESVPRDCLVIETYLPILDLACVNSISFASKQSSRSNGENAAKCIVDGSSFDETISHSVQVTNQFLVSNGTPRRGRGRPRKCVQPPSDTQMLDVEVVTSLENVSSEMLVDEQIKQENHSCINNVISPLIRDGENVGETLVKHQYVRQPSKRGRKRMLINLNLTSDVDDVANPNSGEEKAVEASCMTVESERAVLGSPNNNTHENQPLSKWSGDLNSPAVDSSRSDMVVVAEKVPEKLPFQKKSPIWSALESIEVFHKLPQKPHFKPLENFKDNVREGLAIGLMVTFAGAVERTSNLKRNDPKVSVDDVLETLLELETHGFDVGAVRERIGDLERTKERQEKLEEEARQLEKEMEDNEVEKSRMDEGMEEMKKQMKELQEKLSNVMSMKEIIKGEIDSLQLKLTSVEEALKNVGSEFEDEKSSPWL